LFFPSRKAWGSLALMWTLLLLSAAALAAEPVNPFEEPDESDMYRLQEKLVTVASRYAQTVRMAPSIVELIDADQIRRRGYRTLTDLLRDVTGFYLWKSNEGRDLAAVRGIVSADNNKLLLMVDGVPWYDGVYTHAFLGDYLPLSHIKQVEVIKGPGSAIYGTNAFTGVINIVTMSGEDINGSRFRVAAGATGRSEITALAGIRQREPNQEFNLSAYARIFNQLGDGLDIVPRGRSDIAGYDPKESINVGTKVQINGLEAQIHHVNYHHQYAVSEADDPYSMLGKYNEGFGFHYHNTYFNAGYRAQISRNVLLTPNFWGQRHNNPGAYFVLGDMAIETDEEGTLTGVSQTYDTNETEKDTFRWGTQITANIRAGIDHIVVGGVGIENVEVLLLADHTFANGSHDKQASTFSADTGASVRNLYGYTQYTWTLSPEFELTAGGRLDKRVPSNDGESNDNRVFRLFASPRAGMLFVPSNRVNAKVLYQRAFRSPSVRELLVRAEPDEDGNYEFSSGNLELEPEGIHTAEAEITVIPSEVVSTRVLGSWSRVDNEIDKVTPPNQYQNLPGGLEVIAAEAEFRLDIRRWLFRAAYGLTLASYTETGGPYAGRTQYEFPPHMLKANLGYNIIENVAITGSLEAYSHRPRSDWSPNAQIVDGKPFALAHLAVFGKSLGKAKNTNLGLSVRNIIGSSWSTGVYRDEADVVKNDVAKYPVPMQGEGRSVHVNVEIDL
jgi:outer membrane receptor for ferrienterochelin and colicin